MKVRKPLGKVSGAGTYCRSTSCFRLAERARLVGNCSLLQHASWRNVGSATPSVMKHRRPSSQHSQPGAPPAADHEKGTT